jgi:phage shock protein PspC (stress-responsive transcriptional regulator)
MNRTVNINLGNTAITIDEDAYALLENYLDSLHGHFSQSEGYEEIMNDIEARIAEIINEGMGKRLIASVQDVRNAVSVMGKPEDFGAQPLDESAATQSQRQRNSATEQGKTWSIKTGKRLFRDPDDKAVGGVCSGIAAYFGIAEPLWVRLAFFGLIFFFGTSFWLYIILMLIIPEAKTTADRLAMQGAPIDVNSIAKSVEEGVQKLSENLNNSFNSSSPKNKENQQRMTSAIKNGASKLGTVIRHILNGLGGLGKWILIAISLILVLSILATLVGTAIGVGVGYPIFGYLSDSSWLAPLSIFNIFFIVALPATAIFLLIRRLLYHQRTSTSVHFGIWVFFTFNVLALASSAGYVAKGFNARMESKRVIPFESNADLLTLTTLANEEHNNGGAHFGSLRVSDDFISSSDVSVRLVKSQDNAFLLEKVSFSRGRNREESHQSAENIEYKLETTPNEVKFANSFLIPSGTKWRSQRVSFILHVPVGKKIKIKYAEGQQNPDFHFDSECENYGAHDSDIWLMTEKGFVCLDEKGKPIEKRKKNSKNSDADDADEDEEKETI